MASQPQGLLQQLLRQVQSLFNVPQLEQLPAAMNKVYVHYNELTNFFRALASLLCLPGDAGPGAAMAAISNLLQQTSRPPSKVRQAAAELQQASGITSPAAAPAAAADGSSSSSREAERALQALLAAMRAGSVQQAAVAHQDMKQRLQRLDEVLPRYQRLASQLYERLRVVALDDVLPALDAALAAAAAH
ncbi:hypothetical protein OEZ85_005776 [Tetradesmus obliquus]|uniref:Centrosomal protein of 70 kDa n=1 Tax=Tetradesmus obliquus TaxID=3088 RepID=A0ABY8UI82_TETOB|nr:hypothetical protein OEZ85_005776 [Tetradesmus obliquus]